MHALVCHDVAKRILNLVCPESSETRWPENMSALYHFKGLGVLVTSPVLCRVIICPLLLVLILSIAAICVLFAFALGPQAEALINAGMLSGWAWFTAVLLVLVEAALSPLIVFVSLFGCVQDKIFYQVYSERCADTNKAALLRAADNCCNAGCGVCGLGCALNIVVMVATSWFNLLPIVGTLLFAYCNGIVMIWGVQQPFFDHMGMPSFSAQKRFVNARCAEYGMFGTVQYLLLLIPGFGLVFLCSNAAATALWCADLSKQLDASGELHAAQPYHETATVVPVRGVALSRGHA